VTGRASGPVYLWVNGGRLEVRDAAQVRGQDIYQTQESIKKELNVAGTRVACVGPAAENGVLFAGIFCDHGRAAGRTGLGTVMASKNLKAIAVKGNGKIPLADAERFGALRSESNRVLKADNTSRVEHELGTAGIADYSDYMGSMPKKYYRLGALDGVDKVSGSTMSETILAGTSACHGCVVACGRVVNLGDGKRKGPEYETIVGFGPNILIRDLSAITRLGEICDRAGMDVISASGTLGMALHLFERGIITEKDTGGMVLKWEDESLAAELLHMTARREGFGALLAQGSRQLGRHFNAERKKPCRLMA
jgi:aldehyde:ferredoxin oxidoreductase